MLSFWMTASACENTKWSCCFVGSELCSDSSSFLNSSNVFMLWRAFRFFMRSHRMLTGASSAMRRKSILFFSTSTSAGFRMLLMTTFSLVINCRARLARTPGPCRVRSSFPSEMRTSLVGLRFRRAASRRRTSESERWVNPCLTRYSAAVSFPAQYFPVIPIIIKFIGMNRRILIISFDC